METIKELYSYRQMIFSLIKKDLRGRYKGSVLGFLWTFLNPLLQLGVYTILFSYILPTGIEKYYLFLFVALVPWLYFSSALVSGASCIWAQQDMVKKIYFPREVLPVSLATSQFMNMLFSFIVTFAIIIISGNGIDFKALCFLPLIMLVEYALVLGITMISAAITVYLRDMEYILGIVSMAWMYLTPVLYDISVVPDKLLWLINLNPMTPIIIAYRSILYYGLIPDVSTLGSAVIESILILTAGWFIFGRLKKHFVEEL